MCRSEAITGFQLRCVLRRVCKAQIYRQVIQRQQMLLHTNSTMIVRSDRKDANARYAEGAGIEVKRNYVCRSGWHKSMQGFRKYFLPELQRKLCSNHPLYSEDFSGIRSLSLKHGSCYLLILVF